MLTARLTKDNKWIVVEGTHSEVEQVKLSFTKKVNSWFVIKKKNPLVNVDERFMNQYGMIPCGLWVELINVCKKFNYNIKFQDDFDSIIKDNNLSRIQFDKYIGNLFKSSEIKPKDYQTDGVFNMLLYKKCCVEVSTSGGKTLMSYMLFKYMIDELHLEHILFVTPKTNLTSQSADKFLTYDESNGILTDWTYSEIHANAKKQEKYDENIVFGNYQSLCRKPKTFFDKFDAVIIDEAHHSQNASCRKILVKCDNAKYKIGMTGTFPMTDSYDSFVIQSYIGPVVYRLSSHNLINEQKFATPVYVTSIFLNYLDMESRKELFSLRISKNKDDPTEGNKILSKEKDISRKNYTRFKYICDMIGKTTKNTLVIFSDIENEYGRKMHNHIKENTKKNVYYIDGETPTKVRDEIKNCMENDMEGNTVIVASMGCFSEGIDIANLWNIFLVEDTKSDNILAQILGRGMRRFEGKDKTMMIDFVDDFRYGNGYYEDNYLYRHGRERIEIYKRRGFPHSSIKISLK